MQDNSFKKLLVNMGSIVEDLATLRGDINIPQHIELYTQDVTLLKNCLITLAVHLGRAEMTLIKTMRDLAELSQRISPNTGVFENHFS